MTTNPTPVNPELIKYIDDSIFEAVYNYEEPLDEISTLPAMREFTNSRYRHLLDGLSFLDYQVLFDAAVERQRAELLFRFGLLDQLHQAAHPTKKKQTGSND